MRYSKSPSRDATTAVEEASAQGRYQDMGVGRGVLHDDGLAGPHGYISHQLRVVGKPLSHNVHE